MSEYVYWFEGGEVLHRSPDCRDLLMDMRSGHGAPLRCCDIAAEVMAEGQPYPPDDLEPCSRCAS